MPSYVIPTMRYENAPAMIDWLCQVFGFERHAVHADDNGGIAHAQLTLGDGMIMLGSARGDAFGKAQSTPKTLGGTTQSAYIVVPDADAVYARALATGAKIVLPIEDKDYAENARDFSCLDPEGQLWNVGTYNPWRTG